MATKQNPRRALIFTPDGWRRRKHTDQILDAELVLVIDPPGYRVERMAGRPVARGGRRVKGKEAHALVCGVYDERPHIT